MSNPRIRSVRRNRPWAWALPWAAWLAALLLLPGLAAAMEWSIPPGINVGAQEEALKARVTRQARSMVGDALIEVIVHVGYARLDGEEMPAAPDRVKLPGFNNYIVSSQRRSPEIVSEFARVRQVFVIVSDQIRVRPESLARDLARQSGLDPAQGDSLRVIPVTVPEREVAGPPEPPLPGVTQEPENGEAQPPAEEAELRKEQAAVKPLALAEPKSTAFLMQARRRYFAGDFQGALEQILQAVTVNPNSAEAYSMLGSLYYAMNWRSLAIKYWERSLEIDPSNREIENLVTQMRVRGR